MPGPTSARADDGPAGTGLLLPDERGAILKQKIETALGPLLGTKRTNYTV
jgi:Tfp pilus assembly protein PilZ